VLCGSDIGCSSALLGPDRTRGGCYACATRAPPTTHVARKKPPAATEADEGARRDELDSADTLANYEDRGAKHMDTLDRRPGEAQRLPRTSCHPEGTSGPLVVA